MDEREFKALEHIKKLMKDNTVPFLSAELSDIPELVAIHEELKAIREVLYSFSTGDLSPNIRVRGILPGCLKALQAHLRHMIWQVQMVEQGDFSQQVQFMGEFSVAFNNMVLKLDATLKDLKSKEETLMALTNNLRSEVDLRNLAVEALQESESRFKYLASHDPLTGALNRRSFMERAAAALRSASFRKIACSIVMMDIDHFKRFNDTYGHQAGDEALQHTVAVISALLRKNDFLGRYGGEEFVFLFHNANQKTGILIAERIREALAESPIKIESGTVHITASFGIALAENIPSHDDNAYIESLIHRADTALYQAKEAGRNKVVFFTSEEIVIEEASLEVN